MSAARLEYFYVCATCGWQLQFGDVPMLYLGPMRNEVLAILKQHEVDSGHQQWWIRSVPWVRVHR